jgi:hypothetical protein
MVSKRQKKKRQKQMAQDIKASTTIPDETRDKKQKQRDKVI